MPGSRRRGGSRAQAQRSACAPGRPGCGRPSSASPRPRWIFTVISLSLRSPATCLFILPAATSSITWRSRGEGWRSGRAGCRSRRPVPAALRRAGSPWRPHPACPVAERLGQEIHRAGLHSPDAHRNVAVSGDQDDRQRDIQLGQARLEVQAAGSRKPDVEHQAAGDIGALGGEKLGDGGVHAGAVADRAKQAVHRAAHRLVVVDDMNDRSLAHAAGDRPGRRPPQGDESDPTPRPPFQASWGAAWLNLRSSDAPGL